MVLPEKAVSWCRYLCSWSKNRIVSVLRAHVHTALSFQANSNIFSFPSTQILFCLLLLFAFPLKERPHVRSVLINEPLQRVAMTSRRCDEDRKPMAYTASAPGPLSSTLTWFSIVTSQSMETGNRRLHHGRLAHRTTVNKEVGWSMDAEAFPTATFKDSGVQLTYIFWLLDF